MPNAWDDTNVKANLALLAGFDGRTKAKLTVTTATGRFSRQEAGVGTTLARTFTRGESLANASYLDALTRLFQRAIACCQAGTAVTGGRVEREDVTGAVLGLERLVRTYSGEKRFTLLRLVEGIKATIPVAYVPARSLLTIRHTYRTNLVVSFNQYVYLEANEGGVCEALCLDWVRRQVLAAKPSLTASKKADPAPVEDRVKKKIDKRVRKVQGILEEGRYDWRGDAMLARIARTYPKYTGLLGQRCFHGEGEPVSRRIGAIVERCRSFRTSDRFASFLMEVYGDETEGHTLGMQFNHDRFRFFDPNVGEFQFQDAEAERFRSLFAALWDYYDQEQGSAYTGYRVIGFKRGPEGES